MGARQHVLPDEPLQPHQVDPLTLPHVRDVYGQFSGSGRPAAMPGPLPVRDAHQGLAHGRHALIPAVREQ
ncbi:hypothetical protein [Streptomyces anulatus]|uniref:hypothetical protein n=1 Tax=Streptomyces anulatus TaxID=1892 RepID=UPI0036BAB0DD